MRSQLGLIMFAERAVVESLNSRMMCASKLVLYYGRLVVCIRGFGLERTIRWMYNVQKVCMCSPVLLYIGKPVNIFHVSRTVIAFYKRSIIPCYDRHTVNALGYHCNTSSTVDYSLYTHRWPAGLSYS